MPGVLLCYSVCQAHRGAPLAGVLLCSLVHQAPKEAPGGGVLLCCSMCQALDGAIVSIVQLLMLACGEREAMVMALPPRHDSAVSPCFHGCLAPSTGISHHNLLPDTPSVCLSAVARSSCPGFPPQSLCSSSQPLHLLGALHPCLGYIWLQQVLSDSHSIYAAMDQLLHPQL